MRQRDLCREWPQKAEHHVCRRNHLPRFEFCKKARSFYEDEPRMNTNRHEDRWTFFNHKRHQNASAILLLLSHFVSFVDNLLDFGCHPPIEQRIIPFIGVHSCPFVVRRSPSWISFIGGAFCKIRQRDIYREWPQKAQKHIL